MHYIGLSNPAIQSRFAEKSLKTVHPNWVADFRKQQYFIVTTHNIFVQIASGIGIIIVGIALQTIMLNSYRGSKDPIHYTWANSWMQGSTSTSKPSRERTCTFERIFANERVDHLLAFAHEYPAHKTSEICWWELAVVHMLTCKDHTVNNLYLPSVACIAKRFPEHDHKELVKNLNQKHRVQQRCLILLLLT